MSPSDPPTSGARASAETRVFVLSPANLSGLRGERILDRRGTAPFMDALRGGDPVPIGDVYAFVSSLYYRGKRLYAEAFGRPPSDGPATLVITPSRGLVPDRARVGLDDLAEFASCEIDASNPTYVDALTRSAVALDRDLRGRSRVILLGSIASDKYVGPLSRVFGPRLFFPRAFIGRGDMSRGGLLLRCVANDRELEYVPALNARRRGSRPPKLDARTRPDFGR